MDNIVGGSGGSSLGAGEGRARSHRGARGLMIVLSTWAVVVAALALAPLAQAAKEASPEVHPVTGGFTWESQGFAEEWGYDVAISKCSSEGVCKGTEEFEVEKIPGIQSFVPYAQNITKFTPESTVYVGLAVLPKRKGTHAYRVERVAVPLQGESSPERLAAPKELWKEGTVANWSGLGEEIPNLTYKIGVSTGPRFCLPEGCRKTKYVEVPAQAGRSFSPCSGHFGFTPEPSTAYVGVATLKFKNQPVSAVFTGSEVAVTLSPCPPPTATTAVSSLTQSFALLEGHVDPLGSKGVECFFEYATVADYNATGSYGHKASCLGWAQGEEPKAADVSLPIGGLAPETAYHFRLVASAPGIGIGESAQTFTTLAPPPTPIVKQPPVNLAPPTLSGTPIAGYNDSLNVTSGVWAYLPSYAYQWERCDATGNSCAKVIGATANSFPLSGSDVGHRLQAAVTATNGDGSSQVMAGPSAVIGSTVGDKVEWERSRSHGATLFVGVAVLEIPVGGMVELACQGHGCPFHAKKVDLTRAQPRCRHHPCKHVSAGPRTQVTLAYPFGHGAFRPGTVLTARVARAGWATRVSQFTTRGRGREAGVYLCVVPGAAHPVACPS